MIDERDDAATKLEKAEIQLCQDANKDRLKANKKGKNNSDGAELGGLRWLDPKKRPTHRLKPIVGKKVDTIEWSRHHLAKIIPKVHHSQMEHVNGETKLLSAVFVEFDTQTAAQTAFAMVAHNEPKHIVPRQIGILPGEIIWKNLRMKYWETQIRWMIATGIISVLVIFWGIPVAFVGILTNVNYLTENGEHNIDDY